ncbi:unnamed protein product [Rhizopus stolonifer]
MSVVTDKISRWVKKREDYRNFQSMKEAMSQKPVFLELDIMSKLALVQSNVTILALESIKSELVKMKLSEKDSIHVSHVQQEEKKNVFAN